MITQLCKLCCREIGLMGWAKHVAMEKRLFGEDCYKPQKPLIKKEKSLLEYAEKVK